MKATLTLIAAAAALGLSGAAIAQTDSAMSNGSSMSGKKMHHAKTHMKKKSSAMSSGSDTNAMHGGDMGSANGATPNGGDTTSTTPGNSSTPQ